MTSCARREAELRVRHLGDPLRGEARVLPLRPHPVRPVRELVRVRAMREHFRAGRVVDLDPVRDQRPEARQMVGGREASRVHHRARGFVARGVPGVACVVDLVSKRARVRRKRRQSRAGIKHGRAAYPRHTNKGGRTGSVHAKKSKSKARAVRVATTPRSITETARCQKCGALPGEQHRHG